MREGTTSRVTAADRPYGEFYDFYSVSPENFGSTLVHSVHLFTTLPQNNDYLPNYTRDVSRNARLQAQCQCSVTSTTPAKCPYTCYKPPLSNPIKIRCVFLSRCYSRTDRRTGMARQKVHNKSIANQTVWYICCS
jgi:hypothetical protein